MDTSTRSPEQRGNWEETGTFPIPPAKHNRREATQLAEKESPAVTCHERSRAISQDLRPRIPVTPPDFTRHNSACPSKSRIYFRSRRSQRLIPLQLQVPSRLLMLRRKLDRLGRKPDGARRQWIAKQVYLGRSLRACTQLGETKNPDAQGEKDDQL